MEKEILSNLIIVSILTVICSFLVVNYLIPKIIFMVNIYNLSEQPGERSSHKKATPTMGGLSFFVVLILAIFFFKYFDSDAIGLNLVAALTVIFIIGLKDDLAVSTPRARLLVEIFAIMIMLFHSGFHSISLDGFLGIYEMPEILMDIIHILILLTIINAYNMIDGIDGLASILGISIFSIFGLIFYASGLHFYFLLCLSLGSILLSYLRYNLSHENKIFMGDTGSLIIGFCIAVLSLEFLTMESSLFAKFTFASENKIFVIVAILSIPLFDMMRVIGVRLLQRKSPFEADRNHIHHILLDLGMPHYRIAMLLGFLNYGLAIIIIFISSFLNSFQMLGVLLALFVVLLWLFYRLKMQVVKRELAK